MSYINKDIIRTIKSTNSMVLNTNILNKIMNFLKQVLMKIWIQEQYLTKVKYFTNRTRLF